MEGAKPGGASLSRGARYSRGRSSGAVAGREWPETRLKELPGEVMGPLIPAEGDAEVGCDGRGRGREGGEGGGGQTALKPLERTEF